MKTKINIYSIDIYGEYQYEFSTDTTLNCSQSIMKVIAKNNLIKEVKEHNRNYVWLNKIITDKKLFRNENIIGLQASYK